MSRSSFSRPSVLAWILVHELILALTILDGCCVAYPSSSRGTTVVDDILQLDAISLSRAIEAKKISCFELMRATLDRMNDVNPRCNAIILLRDGEELMAEARRADDVATDRRRGWLHGIPTAIKDVSNAKGIPTTMGGSRLSSNFVPNFDDYHVAKMKKAGAIIIGKTNAPEYGLGSHTYNDVWGTTSNPFDLKTSAGGSSGGAAVAVSTRMLCFADGTDMMGSLRNPAGWNNIYSHRPTAGMIRGGQAYVRNPLPYPTSTSGPMARTPMDCAMLLETMAGGMDAFDSSLVLRDEEFDPGKLRIGWLGDWGRRLPLEDGVDDLCRIALSRLEDRGVVVDVIIGEIFPLDQLWDSWNSIRYGTMASLFSKSTDMDAFLGDTSPIKEDLRWEIEQGMRVSDEELSRANDVCREYAERLDALFGKYDVLALPSAQLFPFPKEWKWPNVVGGAQMDTYHRWMQVCVPASLGGLPCTTIPAGFGPNGLPLGIQLFARRGDDAKTLLLARAYHGIFDWPSNVEPSDDDNALLSCCVGGTG